MIAINAASYRTREGDVLDEIALARYGVREGATEAVLAANPDLRDAPAILTAGLIIALPDWTPPGPEAPLRLWD